MKRGTSYAFFLLGACVVGIGPWKVYRAGAKAESSPITHLANWSPQYAAHYLDHRKEWWQYWPAVQRDHGTVCISCHTAVPYAMTRSTLSRELHESEIPAPQKVLIDGVVNRVTHWSEMIPFYSDAVDGPGKTAESHASKQC
jgi:hypothetical protein